MRRIIAVFAVFAAISSIGCPGKPTSQPTQAAPDQPKPAELPKARVRLAQLTADDWKSALPRDYPAPLRQGMSNEQLARDLELQAWAFDFNGGPLLCWLEFEESGQKTMPAREPAQGDWECDAKDGRIVFSVGRGASDRMKRIMQKLGKDAHPESVTFNLKFRPAEGKSGSFGTSHGSSTLWYGWPGEKTFVVRADPVITANEGEAVTLLRVECPEPSPANKDMPRKAVLILKGSFGKSKK